MIIGLTGKSCSGKNYVGLVLQEIGLEVWDLDVIAHDGLIENVDSIISAFGPEVVNRDGESIEVSRKAIGKVVFSDPSKRKELEDILYPWLRKRIEDWDRSHPDGVLVINGALLYRSGFCDLCSCVIYVDASCQVRRQRALIRDGMDDKGFDLREASQADVDYRDVDYAVPVHVIRNDEARMDKLRQQVFNICDRIGIR